MIEAILKVAVLAVQRLELRARPSNPGLADELELLAHELRYNPVKITTRQELRAYVDLRRLETLCPELKPIMTVLEGILP